MLCSFESKNLEWIKVVKSLVFDQCCLANWFGVFSTFWLVLTPARYNSIEKTRTVMLKKPKERENNWFSLFDYSQCMDINSL